LSDRAKGQRAKIRGRGKRKKARSKVEKEEEFLFGLFPGT
jgi:hypothetical protein